MFQILWFTHPYKKNCVELANHYRESLGSASTRKMDLISEVVFTSTHIHLTNKTTLKFESALKIAGAIPAMCT